MFTETWIVNMGHGDPRSKPCPLLVTSGGHHWRPVQTFSFGFTVQGPNPSPMVLTSGGHQSTYSWQAGGTHPTEELSCFYLISKNLLCLN